MGLNLQLSSLKIRNRRKINWINHSWLFLVKAKDEQTVEKVILAAGYAKKMIKSN
jgi:hypothetical protein